MSNTWVAKIKASLLMSLQSLFFPTRLQFTHPSFQPLSCSFIHLPSQVPTSSNINVRHVTKIHAAGEGQLHHSSLLVSCQSGIKPSVNVGWKSERFGWKHRTSWPWDICHYMIKNISISGMNMAQPMQQLLLEENNCTTWDVANPVLSHYSKFSWRHVPIRVADVYHTVCMVLYIFQVMRDFFHQSDFIGELSILSGGQACGMQSFHPSAIATIEITHFNTQNRKHATHRSSRSTRDFRLWKRVSLASKCPGRWPRRKTNRPNQNVLPVPCSQHHSLGLGISARCIRKALRKGSINKVRNIFFF